MGVIKWGLAGVALFVASGAVAMGIVSIGGDSASAQLPPIERKGAWHYEEALADKLDISVEALMSARKAAREEIRASGSGRPSFEGWEEALAGKLGVSVEILKAAQKAAFEQAINEAVAAGRLTEQQGERLKSRAGDRGFPGFGRGPGMAKAAGKGIIEALRTALSAAAEVIGISEDELKQELRSGKSVAEIAAANGVERDDLEEELTDALKAAIAAAQADGKITAEQAARLTNALEEHIDKAIDHKGGLKEPGGGPFMMPGGPPLMPR
ncbi:MAG: hypothetical protein GEU75_11085 [Dehalococcoidia bacterium]|nr:hypothetical protein [Dehalococcoidia bacterium]